LNCEWLKAMEIAAYKEIRRNAVLGKFLEKDELVNEAWLDSIRRLRPDTHPGIIYKFAIRSMRRYIAGGPSRTKNMRVYAFEKRRRQLPEYEELSIDDTLEKYCSLEAVCEKLKKLKPRTKKMLLMRIEGYTQYEISNKLKLSPAMISKIFNTLRTTYEKSTEH